MLLLSRKTGERLVIGDDIVVTVMEVRGSRVRISIDAPREVRVRRCESSGGGPSPSSLDHANGQLARLKAQPR